jgi:ATP-dependent RNA helicase SUPV3L1/SUV3
MEENTQEPTAPEGAPSAPSAQTPDPVPSEAAAVEPVSAETAEVSLAPAAADWSHLRGLQAVEAPAPGWAERSDYSEELAMEMSTRAARFVRSVDDSIVLSSDGAMRWLGDPVARVIAGETPLAPRTVLLADEALTGEERDAAQNRAHLWLAAHVRKLLGPLVALAEGADLPEGARALGAKIAEAFGVLERERVRNEVRGLDQTTRGAFRKLGVRFGSLYIYVPPLLKPGPRALCTQLWMLRRGPDTGADRLLAFASAGRTSFANDGAVSPDAYRVAGFRLCGERVVRVDILERLSDLIRAAMPDFMRAGSRTPVDAHGFLVTSQMTSLTGCSGEAFASILRSLGYESAKVGKAAFEAARKPAPTEPIKPPESAPAAESESAPDATLAEGSEPADHAEASAVEAVEPAEASLVEATGPDETLGLAEGSEPVDHAEASMAEAVEPAEEARAEAVEPAEASPVEATAPDETLGLAAAESDVTPVTAHESQEPEAATTGDVSAAVAEPESSELVEASPEAATGAETPAADEEIEVWRPAPRRPRAPQRPPRQDRAAAPEPNRRHSQHRPPEAAIPVEAVAPAAAEPARPVKRRDETPRRFEGKGDKRGRDERRDFPPRRESRPADPDSPFAKLAALKPLLEQRDKRN